MEGLDILDKLVEFGINEKVDSIILEDEEYKSLCAQKNDRYKRYLDLSLGYEINLTVDRLMCAYVDCSAYYGTVAYKQGILDCIELLQKMGIF